MKLPRKKEHVQAWLRMVDLGRRSGLIAESELPRFFPRCESLAFQTVGQGYLETSKPDDDFRITVNNASIMDQKRNVGDYAAAHFSTTEPLPFGARLGIDTYDGWQGGVLHTAWRMELNYGKHGMAIVQGGRYEQFTSYGPPRTNPAQSYYDDPSFYSYFNNGRFLAPLPEPWYYPDSIKLDRSAEYVSG